MHPEQMKEIIAKLLSLGVLLSTILVVSGGVHFLWQHGFEPMETILIPTDLSHIKMLFKQNSSIAVIGCGLFLLVAIQLIRVGLLFISYCLMRDYRFAAMSLFILMILCYSNLAYQ